jgi:hypothetical protein
MTVGAMATAPLESEYEQTRSGGCFSSKGWNVKHPHDNEFILHIIVSWEI